MTARLLSWWRYIGKHWTVAIIIAFVIAAIVLILVESLVNGLGFNGYNQVTLAHTISGPSAGTVVRTDVSQPGKTLWDWLQLLIIPLVLAVGGLWFSQIQKDREQKVAEQRAQSERDIAQDNQQEATLQEYINKMSELLLDEELCKPTAEEETRKVARVRTLTVLPRLNGRRKGTVLQFLYEAKLINKGDRIVDLTQADLSGAKLWGADLSSRVGLIGASWSLEDLNFSDLREANLISHLSRANLREADLSRTDLSRANLREADLRDTDLREANLRDTDLSVACLSEADLRDTDLRDTDLSVANLSRANLRGADLSGANLYPADLSNADLSHTALWGADLREVDLCGADLYSTNLSGADLSKANLKGAKNITTEELEKQAKSLNGATMPDGTIHP